MAPHLGGMKMKKNVRGDHHHAVSRCIFIAVTKDRLPDVTLKDIAFDLF
jgi:hypothetical protein